MSATAQSPEEEGDLAGESPTITEQPAAAAEAPQTVPDAADDTVGDEQQIVTRFEARLEFDRLVAEQKLDAAAQIGEKMVSLTEKEFGPNSEESAQAHAALADVLSRTGAYDTAEQHYLRTVAIYREADGLFTEHLIDPLLGLGDNYQRASQYANAITAYDEARSLSRHVFGLLNEGQIDILDRMTRTYQDMNDYAKADEQQLAELRLSERSYEEASPEMLDAMYKYAKWLRDSGRFAEERAQYMKVEKIVKDHYGEDSLQMVRPLQETGNSYRAQRIPENQGIESLRDALDILQMHADADRLTTAEVLRDIGDWQVAFSRSAVDDSSYRRAWDLLGGVANGEELRRQWFSGAEYVLREPISQTGLSTDPKALMGHVLIRFDVDQDGRTENASVVNSEPAGMKDEDIVEHIEASRFRPNMADGVIVRAERLALQFNFRYMPDDDEAKTQND